MICDVIINDPNISDVQRQKELEYKRYVQSHIANVSAAWDRMRSIDTIIDFACVEGGIMHSTLIPIMGMYISQHDASKYSTDEWEPYRMMYFSVDDAEKAAAQSSYSMAEQHHYMHNMHHPEFWKSRKGDMTMPAVIEFCCDLIAMSMAKGGTALEYYNTKFDKCKLGDQQQEWAEFIFTEYYKHAK